MAEIPLFEEGVMDQDARLIGSRCPDCSQHAFPAQAYCPRCSNEMEKTTLSQIGELYTYTIIRQGPPWWKDKVPYTVGRVKLPEGVIVKTQIKNDELAPLQIGTKMRIEPHIMINEQGEKVKIYRFCPVG